MTYPLTHKDMSQVLSREYQVGDCFCTVVPISRELEIYDYDTFEHEGHSYWGEVIGTLKDTHPTEKFMEVTVLVRNRNEQRLRLSRRGML